MLDMVIPICANMMRIVRRRICRDRQLSVDGKKTGHPNTIRCEGARVRELRLEMGLSQERFAAKCKLDRTYVGSVERGERNIALRNIEKISKALGISISELTKRL